MTSMIERLEAQVLSGQQRDLYNTSVWSQLLPQYEQLPIAEARPKYEKFLHVFPRASQCWLPYVRAEMRLLSEHTDESARTAQIQRIDDLFIRSLDLCPSLELYLLYVQYVADAKKDPLRVRQAYARAVTEVGCDPNAVPLWTDYLDHVRATAVRSDYENQLLLTEMRKIYREALDIPMRDCDKLWRKYEEFENSVVEVRDYASKLLAEMLPHHRTALAVFRDRRVLREQLDMSILARPFAGEAHEEKQLALWMDLIAADKKNPQRLSKRDLANHLRFAYRQALCHFTFAPDLWLDYASFMAEHASPADAARIYEEAQRALPNCAVLFYAGAEFEERARKDAAAAQRVLEEYLHRQLADVAEIMELGERENAPDVDFNETDVDGLKEKDQESEKQKEKQRGREKQRDGDVDMGDSQTDTAVAIDKKGALWPILQHKRREITLTYIMLMRLMRRAHGIRQAREVLIRAVGCEHCTWHVYVASAMLEYHTNKEAEVASRVMRAAMKKFGSDPAFLLEYIDFLERTNDENNLRVLFEQAIPVVPENRAHEFWNRYVEFEKRFGDPSTIEQVLKRRADVLHLHDPRFAEHALAKRYAFGDLVPWRPYEVQEVPVAAGSARSRQMHRVDPLQGLALTHPTEYLPEFEGIFQEEEEVQNNEAREAEDRFKQMPRPDVSSMLPYESSVASGMAAGVTLIPPAVQQLLAMLPKNLAGPMMPPELVFQMLLESSMPPRRTDSLVLPGQKAVTKRTRTDMEDDDDDEDDGAGQVMDLYRRHRQQSKMARHV